MHNAAALIFTAQDQFFAPGKQQFTDHRIDTIVRRGDGDLLRYIL